MTDKQGNPLVGVRVSLIPENHDSFGDSTVANSLTTTTDGDGHFEILVDYESFKEVIFNLYAVHTETNLHFFDNSISIKADSVATSSGKLTTPGEIKFVISDSVKIENKYVYIPGTPFSRDLSKDVVKVQNSWTFTIEGTSAGVYSMVRLKNKNGTENVELASTFDVKSNETTTITNTNMSTITGTIYQTNGEKAFHATVALIPGNYNSKTMGTLPPHLSTSTDLNGKFTTLFDVDKKYNLHVSSSDDTEQFYRRSVSFESTKKINLSSVGAVQIYLPRTFDISTTDITLVGTVKSQKGAENVSILFDRYICTIEAMASGEYGALYISSKAGEIKVADKFYVNSGDTTIFTIGGNGSTSLHSNFDGVMTNHFYATAYDGENNHLYVGSHDGWLLRYDGHKWTTVKKFSANIKSIAIKYGEIWCGADNEIHYFRNGVWNIIKEIPTFNSLGFSVGTMGSCLIEDKNTRWFALRYMVGKNSVFGIVQNTNNLWKIWNNTVESNFPANQMYRIVRDDTGDKWCASDNGIVRFNPESGRLIHYTPKEYLINDNLVYTVVSDPVNHRVWAGFSNGKIVMFDSKNGGWTSISHNLLDPRLSISASATDKYGNVWFGASLLHSGSNNQDKEGALLVYKKGKLYKIDEYKSIYGGIHGISFDAFNNVWVTTSKAGIFNIKGLDK